MKLTLVDSTHWIGAFYDRDKYKEEGKSFKEWFKKQDGKKSRIIITYGILTEVIARLISKIGFERSNKVLDFILKSDKIDIYNESKELEDQIYEVFRIYDGFSLVDSEIFIIYKSLNCDQLFTTSEREFKRCAGVNISRNPQI